jgi:hypothetical protein
MRLHNFAWLLMIGLSHLSSQNCHAFIITLFPAKEAYSRDVSDLNRNLGLNDRDLIAEDFENEPLMAGLTTNLKGGFGVEGAPTVWDGSKTSTYESEAEFKFSLPDIRLFGIGLGDNDAGDEVLSINGGPFTILQNLPRHVSDGSARAYYLIIEAELGDSDIATVSIRRGLTIAFDHLVVRQGMGDPSRPLQFAVDLVDGSRLIASSPMKSIGIDVSGRMIDIPMVRIASFQPQPEKRMVSMTLRNGDKVTGQVEFDSLSLTTILGEISCVLEKVKRITIQETIQEERWREFAGSNFEAEHNSNQEKVRVIERDRINARSLQVRYEALSVDLKRLSKEEQRKAIPTAFPDPMLNALLSKLAMTETEFAVLTREAGPDDPKIIQLSALMTNLNAQIDARVKDILTGVENQAKCQAAVVSLLQEEANKLKRQDAELMEKFGSQFQAKRNLERVEEIRKLRMLGESHRP